MDYQDILDAMDTARTYYEGYMLGLALFKANYPSQSYKLFAMPYATFKSLDQVEEFEFMKELIKDFCKEAEWKQHYL